MAFSKAVAFSTEERFLAAVARALSHPARVAILKTLAVQQTCVCGELVSALPLAQSTVSQHLKVLREAGLIHGEVEGPTSCYCINPNALEKAAKAFAELFGGLHATGSDGCCTTRKRPAAAKSTHETTLTHNH